ncbi:MAG: hypothetical protein KDA53_15100 [Hyphomonas sp.]|nr:hypothetical protein [Hyphomonas sp.]
MFRTLIVCLVAGLGAGSAALAQEDDPFDKFRKSSETAKKAPPPTTSSPAPAPAPSAPPPSRSSGSAGKLNLYCSGEVKRSTGSFEVQRVPFEFRTVIDTAADKHTVVNVVSGPLFRTGSTYDIVELENDITVLSTEITSKQHWNLTSMRLDMATSKLSGTGTVDLTSVRDVLNARMSQYGKSLPEGGLDSKRKVEVDGSCQALQ